MKIFTILSCFILTTLLTSGQCVPDTAITHNEPGVYPDSITGLPHAIVGLPYATTIQIKVKADTVISGITVPIDSVVLNSVAGLPPGFTYTCTPSNCTFPGGSDACIYLQGPALTTGGTYPLVVNTTAYGVLFGVPQSVQDHNDDYAIIVDAGTGFASLEKINFAAGQNMPNPAKDFTIVPVTLIHSGEISYTVSNVIGKEILKHTLYLQKGKSNVTIDLHGIKPGIYLYTFSNGSNSVTRRMIISND